MNFLRIALVAVTMVLAVACSKNNDKHVSTTIEGVWVGKYGTGSNNPSSFFSFNIKAGGIIEEIDTNGQVKGTGTWKLENNVLYASYTWLPPSSTKFSVLGAFDASKGEIVGDWGYGSNATNGGLWDMTKKN